MTPPKKSMEQRRLAEKEWALATDSGLSTLPARNKGREQNKYAERFPELEDRDGAARQLRSDLAEVAVQDTDGAVTDVYTKLMHEPALTNAQKQRILNVMSDVREHFLHNEVTSNDRVYQDINWKHTRAELDTVLEAARRNKLSAEQTEDAIIASLLSDSVKSANTLLTHNLHGAEAAEHLLPRYFDFDVPGNRERVQGIVNAIREHQISPPWLMAMMAKSSIYRALGAQARAHKSTIDSINNKFLHPMDPEHLTEDGREIAFSAKEKALLSRIGVEHWYVPSERNPWHAVSRAVIDGDSVINYASPDGFAKIVALRGPGGPPIFADNTLWHSLGSAWQSYRGALGVLTPAATDLATQGRRRSQAAIRRMRDHLLHWLESLPPHEVPRNPEGTIAFWDAALNYEPETAPDPALATKQLDFAKRIKFEAVEYLRSQQCVFDEEMP